MTVNVQSGPSQAEIANAGANATRVALMTNGAMRTASRRANRTYFS